MRLSLTKGKKPNVDHHDIDEVLLHVFPIDDRIGDRPVSIDADGHDVDHTRHRRHVVDRHLRAAPNDANQSSLVGLTQTRQKNRPKGHERVTLRNNRWGRQRQRGIERT